MLEKLSYFYFIFYFKCKQSEIDIKIFNVCLGNELFDKYAQLELLCYIVAYNKHKQQSLGKIESRQKLEISIFKYVVFLSRVFLSVGRVFG